MGGGRGHGGRMIKLMWYFRMITYCNDPKILTGSCIKFLKTDINATAIIFVLIPVKIEFFSEKISSFYSKDFYLKKYY